jgi:hypothetical protein
MFGETQNHAQSTHGWFMNFLMYSHIYDLPQDVKKCGNDPLKSLTIYDVQIFNHPFIKFILVWISRIVASHA